jgi:hypothetical protein
MINNNQNSNNNNSQFYFYTQQVSNEADFEEVQQNTGLTEAELRGSCVFADFGKNIVTTVQKMFASKLNVFATNVKYSDENYLNYNHAEILTMSGTPEKSKQFCKQVIHCTGDKGINKGTFLFENS